MDIGQLIGGRRAVGFPGLNGILNTVTLAQVNAGKVVLPALKGDGRYIVTGFWMIPNGAFATLTSIDIETTESTPVIVASAAQAQLTDNNYLDADSTGITLGAGFGVVLTAGAGLRVIKKGSNGATATDILVFIQFQVVSAEVANNLGLGEDQQ